MTLRVAFINQPFNPVRPPAQFFSLPIWIYNVARCLEGQADVTVYSRQEPDQQPAQTFEGIEYRRVPVRQDEQILKVLKRLPASLLGGPAFNSPLYYRGYIHQIARDLQARPCDVVHILNFSQFVPVVRLLNPKAKIVLHMQGEWLGQLHAKSLEPRLRQADAILGCSDHLTRIAQAAFPQFASRCYTVYNGVDETVFSPAPVESAASEPGRPPRLLYVGRVAPGKGVHTLLEAFLLARLRCPGLEVVVAGPIPKDAKMEFLIALSKDPLVARLREDFSGSYLDHLKAILPPEAAVQVTFTGPVQHTQLVEQYRQADILLNPSYSEAFGMSLVEAMACEKPVIGCRLGGMREVVTEGVTGLLVPPGDAAALSEAILKLLEDPALRLAMGKAGRERVLELYSWKQVAGRLLEVYQGLVE